MLGLLFNQQKYFSDILQTFDQLTTISLALRNL